MYCRESKEHALKSLGLVRPKPGLYSLSYLFFFIVTGICSMAIAMLLSVSGPSAHSAAMS